MLEYLLADFDGVLVSQSERGGSGMCESVSMRHVSQRKRKCSTCRHEYESNVIVPQWSTFVVPTSQITS